MYFCHGRKTKNKPKCISAMEERQKTNQNVFMPWKKDKKNNDGDGKYQQHYTPNGLGTST